MENTNIRMERDIKRNYSKANTGDTPCDNLLANEEDESTINMDEMVVVDELSDEEQDSPDSYCKAGTSSTSQETGNIASSSFNNDSDIDDMSDKELEDGMMADSMSDKNDSEMDDVSDKGLEKGKKGWFQCAFCKQSFTKIRHRDNHYLQNHLNEDNVCLLVKTKIHSCKFCDSFKTVFARELRKHLSWKHKNEDIVSKCSECGFRTMRTASFNKHMRTHEATKKNLKINSSIRCKYCPIICRGQKVLRNHMLFKHSKQASNLPDSQVYTCRMCSTYKTAFKGHLKIHMRENHQGHIPELMIHCKQCDFSTRSISALNFHKKEHHPVTEMHKCNGCSQQFNTKIVLDKHIVTRHYEFKDLLATVTCKYIQCSLCDFCALTPFHMDKHNFRYHKELVPPHPSHELTCRFCYNMFEYKEHLHKHLLKKHFKEDLSKEIAYHRERGPTPQTCMFCSIKLPSQESLRKHLFKRHSKEDVLKAIGCK